MNLQQSDLDLLQEKGITPERLEEQLTMLSEGFPWLKLEGAATPGHGISVMSPQMETGAINCWDEFLSKGGIVMKLVPASGAASRMFKDLYSFVNGKSEKPDNEFMVKFFDNIEKFAFFNRLNFVTIQLYGKSVNTLLKEKRYKDIVKALIEKEGMGYGSLPKALLQFHKVIGTTRTALEEQLAEGAQYATDRHGKVRIHFTVSEEHLPLAKMKVEESAGHLGNEYNTEFEVSYSLQKPSTDTVAANVDGTPYRENGNLFFRPGGHGALIENLNELDADVIFIKNIDNVVPDNHRESTVHYKKVLGGTLVAVKQKIDEYCRIVKDEKPDDAKLEEIINFMRNVLCITHDSTETMNNSEKREYIFSKLNRPLRVCGMVRNEGEPGGGPFMVYNADGTVSPQILESSQINPDDKESMEMLRKATHFNPVDLAVSVRDYKGNKFNLPDYVDKSTGFISSKSREGVEIKALELPGLWNGAMSEWNTIFIEVPADTFNPVKTVNDLLRPAHQPE
ncbi:MAG: DUF4301 family protein [Muribaculaceae bacterium]|nr:DUF4301 family protein [Muribaculaceae bacterium]